MIRARTRAPREATTPPPAPAAPAEPPTPLQRLTRLEGVESLPLIVSWKLAVVLIILVAHSLLPFRGSRGPITLRPPNPSIEVGFKLWDSDHYLLLAKEGYQPEQIDNAFAPLYPFAMTIFAPVIGFIASGLLVSNLASALGLYLLYVMTKRRFGQEVALKSLVLILAFPTAFYFNLIYTEALFLLLTVGFFLALYRRALGWTTVFAVLITLTRFQGFVIVVPFAVFLWLDGREEAAAQGLDYRQWFDYRFLYLIAPFVALLLFFWYLHAVTGDALAAMHAQDKFIAGLKLGNVLKPWLAFENLFASNLTLHSYRESILDRVCFVLFLASLPLVYRRVDKPLFAFCVFMGLTPFLGSYMSYMRYLVVAFPLFIAYASKVEKLNPYLFCAALFPLLCLQGLFIALHFMNYWVA